jgi:LPXTG-motif cell wall-anchored protein
MARTTSTLPFTRTAVVLGVAAALSLTAALPAQADTVIGGPVGLGTAATYGVLAGSAITNTGPSVVDGDVGVSAEGAVTGFDPATGPGVIAPGGVVHVNDAASAQAQADLTTAYDIARSLTPQESGITELANRSLTPGVYSGGEVALSANGTLTFAGTAESVWVIQAASSLTIGSATTMVLPPGASACNVFWQVGSSATIGSGSQFRGTVLAQTSVTVNDASTVIGRLLARTGAVTLINDVVTVPEDCAAGDVTSNPTITSGAPGTATAGTPYTFPVTASGAPSPTFTVTAGTLPTGLSLDSGTGVISGTPTTPGSTTVTITASNGDAPADSETYVVTVAAAAGVPPVVVPPVTPPVTPPATTPPVTPAVPVTPVVDRSRGQLAAGRLANTGAESTVPALVAGLALMSGVALVVTAAVRRRRGAGGAPGAHVAR